MGYRPSCHVPGESRGRTGGRPAGTGDGTARLHMCGVQRSTLGGVGIKDLLGSCFWVNKSRATAICASSFRTQSWEAGACGAGAGAALAIRVVPWYCRSHHPPLPPPGPITEDTRRLRSSHHGSFSTWLVVCISIISLAPLHPLSLTPQPLTHILHPLDPRTPVPPPVLLVDASVAFFTHTLRPHNSRTDPRRTPQAAGGRWRGVGGEAGHRAGAGGALCSISAGAEGGVVLVCAPHTQRFSSPCGPPSGRTTALTYCNLPCASRREAYGQALVRPQQYASGVVLQSPSRVAHLCTSDQGRMACP